MGVNCHVQSDGLEQDHDGMDDWNRDTNQGKFEEASVLCTCISMYIHEHALYIVHDVYIHIYTSTCRNCRGFLGIDTDIDSSHGKVEHGTNVIPAPPLLSLPLPLPLAPLPEGSAPEQSIQSVLPNAR